MPGRLSRRQGWSPEHACDRFKTGSPGRRATFVLPALRPPAATPDFTLLPRRLLAVLGSGGLMAITLVSFGATRMYATPWTLALMVALAVPPLLLALRLLDRAQPLRLPPRLHTALILGAAVVPLLAAAVSPYRATSLLQAAFPASGAALVLVLFDWLEHHRDTHSARLENLLAGAGGLAAVVSFVFWLQGALSLPREQLLSRNLFEFRNVHPLGHPNYTAGLMLLALPWLCRACWRHHGWPSLAAAATAALACFNIFTSGSRGGLIGLLALALLAAFLFIRARKLLFLVVLGACATTAVLALVHPRVRAFLQPADPLAEPNLSTVQRHAMLEAGWLLGRDRPLLGWGPGATPLAYPRYRAQLDGGVDTALQLHNTPVQLWAEMGFAGVLLVLICSGLLALSWRRSRVAAATLGGYAAFSLTDFQLDVPIFLAFLAAGGALLLPTAKTASCRSCRIAVGTVALLGGGVILTLGRQDPTPELNVRALALAQVESQRYAAAALLRESLALNPDQEIAHFNLGWLLVVPEPATAERHFLRTLQLVPDKGGAYFGLALARLNQGRNDAAARALALECLNDPQFLASPWWNTPALAALRGAAAAHFSNLLSDATLVPPQATWTELQLGRLATLTLRLGEVSPGPERVYHRERIGYPVLMRNSDLPIPVDLYDVREDPRFAASVPFPLPSKGWLPAPRLLKLLDSGPMSSP